MNTAEKQRISPYIFPGLINTTSDQNFIIQKILSFEGLQFEDVNKRYVQGVEGDVKKMIQYFLFRYTNLSLKKIGFIFKLDSVTVSQSIKRFNQLLQVDTYLLKKFVQYDQIISQTIKQKRDVSDANRNKQFTKAF